MSSPFVRPSAPSVLTALRHPRMLTRESLAGLVVALALIPEAIAFSVIVGVDPRVGLFSSFIMAVAISFLGGRAAMISASTGAVALVVAPVMRDHGFDYLIATILLGGAFQIVFAFLGVARLLRFIPRSVMVGFVNSLALLVVIAQLPQLIGVPWAVYALVAVGIGIIVIMPKITSVVPAPLVSIVVVTVITVVCAISVPTVGDEGALPDSLPALFFPDVPLTGETFAIIAPYALGMAVVGLLESLLTAGLVDEITDTRSNKKREAWGQGIANILSACFGGMGGCAVIGQTMMNVKVSGARTRLSTFLAGVFLIVLVVGLGDVVAMIPMAALVAVMIMVSVAAFDWHSVTPSTLRRMPLSETAVMVITVISVLVSHNLAIGVGMGVVAASLLFVRRVAHVVRVHRSLDGETARYTVTGELFFASSNDLTSQFAYAEDPQHVVIDFTDAHVWDASTVAALDAITTRYAARGIAVDLVGMNAGSARFHQRLSGMLGTDS